MITLSARNRLDQRLLQLKLVSSRSQAENIIKLGTVTVNGITVSKPGVYVSDTAEIKLKDTEQYVSRAGLKLASVSKSLGLSFTDKIMLDVGSSTGGFTDYALQHGAKMVMAVDVGTEQLHPSLRRDKRIELHEKTDIRKVGIYTKHGSKSQFPVTISKPPDIIVIDVSFVSLRELLPHIVTNLCNSSSLIVAMVKPQFEAGKQQVNKGVIKNDAIRRQILKDFEQWAKQYFIMSNKADSAVPGSKGNLERFYLLKPLAKRL